MWALLGIITLSAHAFPPPVLEVFRFANGNILALRDGNLELHRGNDVIPLGPPKLVPVGTQRPDNLTLELDRRGIDYYLLEPQFSFGILGIEGRGNVILKASGIYVPFGVAERTPDPAVEVKAIQMKDGPALISKIGGAVHLIDTAGETHFLGPSNGFVSTAGRANLEALAQNFSEQTREEVTLTDARREANRQYSELSLFIDRFAEWHRNRLTAGGVPQSPTSRYAITVHEHKAFLAFIASATPGELQRLQNELGHLRAEFESHASLALFETAGISPVSKILRAFSRAKEAERQGPACEPILRK